MIDYLVTVNLKPGTDPHANVDALWSATLWCRETDVSAAGNAVLKLVRDLPGSMEYDHDPNGAVWVVTDIQPAKDVIA